MKNKITIYFITLFCLSHSLSAQEVNTIGRLKDSIYLDSSPLVLQTSTLFSRKNIGTTVGVGRYLVRKQLFKHKKSGTVKIVKRDRLICANAGYYYQAGLHQSWFLTASYQLRRTWQNGLFMEFSPMIGVSRTFLTEETYTVSDNGTVALKKFQGNWYLLGGFATGIGKEFKANRNFFLKELHLSIYSQLLYPNFGFVALKPFLQLGTSFDIEKLTRQSKNIIKHK